MGAGRGFARGDEEETFMRNACTLMLVLGMNMGSAMLAPQMSFATPVDPEILDQIGRRAINPGRSKKDLVERGRRLFFEETFGGNGRTCGTCHPATNNFTIDPAFIARLPADDPLFVAEFNPALARLEKPRMLRRFGLILENLDGFRQPGVMRGVPHNLAMPTSMQSDLPGIAEATGWSGDGSPGGTLREFTVGAIVQHLPRTLARRPGVDFRLPTDLELDAMEAFMLSVGRQEDVDLLAMRFRDRLVDHGRRLFLGEGVNRACHACHANAGARTSFGVGSNANFDTGTRLLTQANYGNAAPPDGGFGADASGRPEGGFGDGTMNTPPLIEAADTPPFFHNNAARTLEAAIAFYTSRAFAASPAGQPAQGGAFDLEIEEINAIGAMLRTLNAMENIRYGNLVSDAAQRTVPPAAAMARVAEVVADTEDAIEVLTGGPRRLYPEAVALLREALGLERQARATTPPPKRNALLRRAVSLKERASAMMAVGD
jgi:cytochrome c peroxidase